MFWVFSKLVARFLVFFSYFMIHVRASNKMSPLNFIKNQNEVVEFCLTIVLNISFNETKQGYNSKQYWTVIDFLWNDFIFLKSL